MSATLQEIANLKTRLAALEEQARAEEQAKKGIIKPMGGGQYHRLYQDFDGTFKTSASSTAPAFGRRPFFGNKAQAEKFAKAIQIILEMRMQPGIAVPDVNDSTCVVIPQRNGTIKFQMSKCTDAFPSTLFARFEDRTSAEAAVHAVGADRVLSAAKIMSFFE